MSNNKYSIYYYNRNYLISDTKTSGKYKEYIIPANYSGWYLNHDYNLENKLNYFIEDIGLNTYYFFLRQAFPFWLPSKEYDLPDYRGEEYLYSHKLLLNRYYLERLSNDLPYLEEFDWQKPFYPGYYPTMTYSNGLPFPQRPIWSNFPIYKYKYIRVIEKIRVFLGFFDKNYSIIIFRSLKDLSKKFWKYPLTNHF